MLKGIADHSSELVLAVNGNAVARLSLSFRPSVCKLLFYCIRVQCGKPSEYSVKWKCRCGATSSSEEAATDFFKKALFIIAAGSNDILEYLSPSVLFFGREKPDPSYFQDALISNLTFYLKRLNELGARKFVVSDVGPLDCIPYVRALEFVPAGECSASANWALKVTTRNWRGWSRKWTRRWVRVYDLARRGVSPAIRRRWYTEPGIDNRLHECCCWL